MPGLKIALTSSLMTALLALVVPAGAAQAAHQARWRPDPPTWGVQQIDNVPITMSDGTVLRADVAIPTPADGSPRPAVERFPVLLQQTPYYKEGPVTKINPYFVQRGYAMVLVDVRGTGSSQGQWQVLGQLEQHDGAELARWAAGQPWSDGRVGLYGGSYGAIAALLTAEQPDLPSAVKAVFAAKPAGDIYRDLFFNGGGSFNAWGAGPFLALTTAAWAAPAQQTASGSIQDLLPTLEHYPNADIPFQVVSDALTGGDTAYDGAFWQERSPLTHIDRVHVATFIVGGEFDLFQRGEPILFSKLRVPKRLLLGPWVHTQESTNLPADGIPSEPELALQWFDQYLRGQRTRVNKEPAVIQYRLEGARPSHFVTSSSYPLKGLHAANLYLDAGPSGSAHSLNDGKLEVAPPHASGSDALPYKPVDTGCTRSTIQWGGGAVDDSPTPDGSGEYPCATDQRENELQTLTYTTPPLTRPITIDGPINVHLVAQSPHGRNTSFAVTLTDVQPDGSSIALTSGWLVASLRKTAPSPVTSTASGLPLRVYHPFTRSSEQQPATSPTSYDIEVFPTFATFLAGDRIRLEIYTGDVPHLAPGAQQQADSLGGTFLIDHGPRAQSYITLPELRTTTARSRFRRPTGHPAHHHRPHHKRPRRSHPHKPAMQITYGISPTAAINPPDSAVAKLAFAHLDYLRHGGAFLVHLYLPWNTYPGNLAGIDAMVAALAARGYKADLVLRYAPPSGHDGDLAGYAQFVRAIVDHYAHQRAVVRLGITNESNFGLDERGSMGGADGQYSDPVGALIAGMNGAYQERARDHAHMKLGFNWAYRTCNQSNCGPTADTDYWSELGQRGGAGFAKEVDWVTMDIYPGTIFPPGDPSADPYQPGLSPRQEVAHAMEDLRYQMLPLAGLGIKIPIGIQEISWASLPPARSEQQQADLLMQFAAGACDVAAQTNFRTFYWFTLNDQSAPAAGQLNFGLYHADGSPKPAAAAYAQVIAHACAGSRT